jgi:serine protease Do
MGLLMWQLPASGSVSKEERQDPFFDFFFGPREQQRQPESVQGIGSGVIISEDGYIVTNYHVIEDATQIDITLNDRRSFRAEI